jgi:iron complex transport system ATP-binding protein
VSALRVAGLEVDLGGVPVLRAVECAIESGGWLGVLGPNGAGKSTLLRAVAGLLPHRGTVSLDGADASELRGRDRARVMAFVPQHPILPPDTTVHEYVLLGRTAHLGYLASPGARDRQIAAAAIGRLDLDRFAARRLSTLSGGESQRVVLARALAQQPRILLLDEPTAALDIGHRQHVLDLVDELRQDDNMTVITTLHDLTTAGQYADSLVLLADGRVRAAGTPTDVMTEQRITQVYDARVVVTTDRHGRPIVTPARPAVTDMSSTQ